MKLLICASLFALASSAKISDLAPKFTLVADRIANEAPRVAIEFPNGVQDTLVLSRYYPNEEQRLARTDKCHFVGHLAREHEACVALTGCPGDEDVDLTILSKHNTVSAQFRWNRDGSVSIIEDPLKNAKTDVLPVRQLRQGGGWSENGDEEVNPEDEAAETAMENQCSDGSCESLPATNLLQIRAGYDDGFLNQVGSVSEAESYIEAVLPHVQAFFCHESLGTQVKIERIGDIKHYEGKNLQATGEKLAEMIPDTKADLNGADLMMYMGYDTEYYGTVGMAWGNVICASLPYKGYKSSINEWRETHASAANTIAHEIGHNFGMMHDFDPQHEAAGCNGQGIMSYGQPPHQWSPCSVADFQAHYLVVKDNWCMEEAPDACAAGTFPTTTTTTTPAPAPDCLVEFIGDGWCDDENNNAACNFDGQDCCNLLNNPFWDSFCNECACHSGDEDSGSDTTTTTTATTPAPNCKNSWIGDQYCDDVNNNAACGYDGGDCCGNSNPTWNAYCDECACLEVTTTTAAPAPECDAFFIGDTYCDDVNNNAACNFDGGDCCNTSNPLWDAFCSDCSCLSP